MMLYWMETVIVAAFAIARIGTVPQELLGKIKINGVERPATHRNLIELFGLMAATFICVHFLFLWLLLSGDWTKTVRGPISFVRVFVIESGAWIPLLFAFVAGAIAFLACPPSKEQIGDDNPFSEKRLLGGFYSRIIVMHLTILIGGFFAVALGTTGALVFMVALKIAIDLRLHLKNDFPEKPKPQMA